MTMSSFSYVERACCCLSRTCLYRQEDDSLASTLLQCQPGSIHFNYNLLKSDNANITEEEDMEEEVAVLITTEDMVMEKTMKRGDK